MRPRRWWAQGNLTKRQSLAERAAALDSGHYRLHAIRGQIYAQEHREQDAIHEYETALASLPPTVPDVLYPTSLRVDLSELYRDAATLRMRNELPKPRAPTCHHQHRGPGRPEFLRLRAATEVATGDTTSAESDLTEALREQPDNIVILLSYGSLLRKTDRRDAALQAYREVLALDPDNPAALGSLGFMMREAGDSKARSPIFKSWRAAIQGTSCPFWLWATCTARTGSLPRRRRIMKKLPRWRLRIRSSYRAQ